MSDSKANRPSSEPVLTLVTPAYNETANIPVLYDRICAALADTEISWEWIIVDDHSADGTFSVISALAQRDARIRGVRFARNFGSHSGITYGLHHAEGHCAVVLASDLQDPPEVIPELLEEWRKGSQVVWAARHHREGESISTIVFSRLYYFMMRRFGGTREMPSTGADFFLIDRSVINAFGQFGESNASVLALLTWMGFRQSFITYDKQARLHGKSGWTLQKKLKLVVDSLTAFSFLPIRLMSYTGFAVALLGFCYAAFVFIHALTGRSITGWSSLMIVLLVVGGLQMLMLGVLGEYLWRALEESRRRPRYLVEDSVGMGSALGQSVAATAGSGWADADRT